MQFTTYAPKTGNAALIEQGGIPFREEDGPLAALLENHTARLREEKKKEAQLGLDFGD